jgi:crotonobetainyl-CoA:carnitine CoA-transferase CaiB-like acyl-CoA transferase
VTSWLDAVKVLDLSIWRPGPYATFLLAQCGADVLKVEPPGGDPMRYYPQLFASVNAGKRSLVLDLKEPGEVARALELARQADVVVEGFRPRVVGRLGLHYAAVRELNPAVIYCSISGYGQEGPRAQLPGHDVNYQAWAGSLAPEGGPATMPPLPSADLASGLTAAFGICAALMGRIQSGEGTFLDISMTNVMATWTGPPAHGPHDSGSADTTSEGSVPGYGLYATSDGLQVALGVVNEPHFWAALCRELGLETAASLTFAERSARARELHGAVMAAVALRGRDELVGALSRAHVPVAPVLDRAAVLASGAMPSFPFPLPLPHQADADDDAQVSGVPVPNQHAGEGFRSS